MKARSSLIWLMLMLAFAGILACSPLSLLSEQGKEVATKAADVASKAQGVTTRTTQTGAEAVSTTTAPEQNPGATKSTGSKVSATDTPTAETSGPAVLTGKIKQRLVGNGVALTVTKAELSKGTADVEPDQGNTFLLVHVIVENTSKTNKADFIPDDFQVKDSNGKLISSDTLGFPDDEMEGGRYSPGGKCEGTIGFQVSQKQKAFHLVYEYEDQEFDVDLGL